jgi:hypothetical protein
MRRPHPGRDLERRRQARARVSIIDVPESDSSPDGAATTQQTAEVTLPPAELDRLWSPEYLERLARTYWRFLTRVSLGLLRVLYTEDSREIVFLGRPFVLLRFHKPEYELRGDFASVTWRIDRGMLVARQGRGRGFLRIWVRRRDEESVIVSSEVVSFSPTIVGRGRFARFGQWLYRETQLRIHVVVTHAFLRSLARLDLVPSVVGALAPSPAARP